MVNYNDSFNSWTATFPPLLSWTLYSNYNNDSNTKILYSISILLTMFLLTFSSFMKLKYQNEKSVTFKILSRQSNIKFSGLLFNCWNYKTIKKHEVYEQKVNIIEEFNLLLHDRNYELIKKMRTNKEKYILFFRKFMGILLNSFFLFLSWIGIINVTANQTNIASSVANIFFNNALVGDLAISALITIIGLILPNITFMITDFERWDTQMAIIINQIWRLYFGRILNLIIAGLQYYSLKNTGTAIFTFISDSVLGLTTVSDNSNDIICYENYAVENLIKLIFMDFFLSKIIKLITPFGFKIINKITKLNLPLTPYNVAESIIELLYTQGLILITLPLYPFLGIISPILIYCNFKFEKLVLKKITW